MPDNDSEVIGVAANILLAKRVQCQIMQRGQDQTVDSITHMYQLLEI